MQGAEGGANFNSVRKNTISEKLHHKQWSTEICETPKM